MGPPVIEDTTVATSTAFTSGTLGSHTVNSYYSTVLLVMMANTDTNGAGATISSMTYNGDALTKYIDANNTTSLDQRCTIWYLLNPDTGGSYNLNVTFALEQSEVTALINTISHVDKNDIFNGSDTSVANDGSGPVTESVSVVSDKDNCLAVSCCAANSGSGETVNTDSPMIELWEQSALPNYHHHNFGYTSNPTIGTITHEYTASGVMYSATAMAVLNGAGFIPQMMIF